MSDDRQVHWDLVYATKQDDEVSWYEPRPEHSLELVDAALSEGARSLVDIGGGTSRLVDSLIARDLDHLAVLDVSEAALARSRDRLGPLARKVEWISADVTDLDDIGIFDIWHDRAVFHFLITEEDRRRYRDLAAKTVPAGGRLIIATFGPDGPNRCSGLDVRRYDREHLSDELGQGFHPVGTQIVDHQTPAGHHQQFLYAMFVRR
jgi:SAM-dependent methyltransferase